MMLAWFSSSEMMKSSLPRIAETVPAFAVKPDWKTTQASTFLKRAIFLFQLHVNTHGAGDGAHGARAHAILLRRLQSGFAQLGVRCQPEVVVGSEVDDLLAVEGAHRRLLVLKHAQLEVRAFLLQVVELVGEEGERVGASGDGCHESPRNKPTF